MENYIKKLQNLLKATYLGEYNPGHMDSRILRFKLLRDGKNIVVKTAYDGNPKAAQEIEANLNGYECIKLLGAESIIPNGLQEITVDDSKAIVMDDLGEAIKYSMELSSDIRILWQNFIRLSLLTRMKSDTDVRCVQNSFIQEIISFVRHFEKDDAGIASLIEKADLTDEYGYSAMMLLDFTPDNVFLTGNKLSFIDPWVQKNYQGHPAVSIGQFITLSKIYNLAGHEETAAFLEEACYRELPLVLNCSTTSIEKALRLGTTLQLVLSAYVRRNQDQILADTFIGDARKLWHNESR